MNPETVPSQLNAINTATQHHQVSSVQQQAVFPQPAGTFITVPQPQRAVFANQENGAQIMSNRVKIIIRNLAIAEIALGSLCFLLGIIIGGLYATERASSSCRRSCDYSFVFTTYEGLWCGVWIIAAGILGVLAARKESQCMVSYHRVFSNFGITFASILCCISVALAAISNSASATAAEIFMTLFSLAACVLHVASLHFCNQAGANNYCVQPTQVVNVYQSTASNPDFQRQGYAVQAMQAPSSPAPQQPGQIPAIHGYEQNV